MKVYLLPCVQTWPEFYSAYRLPVSNGSLLPAMKWPRHERDYLHSVTSLIRYEPINLPFLKLQVHAANVTTKTTLHVLYLTL